MGRMCHFTSAAGSQPNDPAVPKQRQLGNWPSGDATFASFSDAELAVFERAADEARLDWLERRHEPNAATLFATFLTHAQALNAALSLVCRRGVLD